MILTHPALRLLARQKIRGFWRLQARRFRTPSGAIFALIGLGAFLLWISGAILGHFWNSSQGGAAAGASSLRATPLFLFAGFAFTAIGAISFRGLYIPQEEIELLLSAPLTRADIVRYRLISSLNRTAIGGAVVGFTIAARAHSPWFGFAGGWMYTLTLPLFGQAVSLFAGDAENRAARILKRVTGRWLTVLAMALLGLFVFAALRGGELDGVLDVLGVSGGLDGLLATPIARFMSACMTPWTTMMRASSLGEFAPWLLVALCIWAFLFELCARMPVDFRELSLDTAADVAKKLANRRKGGASASPVWSTAIGWHVPWLFGRGPFGSIAWRKSVSIVRKARGTIGWSILVVGMFTFAAGRAASRTSGVESLVPMLVIAVLGTFYLTSGLRFDFREDLERMDVVKTWPIPPWRVFLATLISEVVLVSLVLDIAIVVRGAIDHSLRLEVLALIAALPIFSLIWVALDNVVFLFMPIRAVPGQEGSLQQAGRTMVMFFLRMILFATTVLGAAAPGIATYVVVNQVGWSTRWVWIFGGSGAFAVLIAEAVVAVWVGGRMLARFDVARDRGE